MFSFKKQFFVFVKKKNNKEEGNFVIDLKRNEGIYFYLLTKNFDDLFNWQFGVLTVIN